MKHTVLFSASGTRENRGWRRSDERGSALAWSMAVVMILLIIVTAVLSLSMNYANRSFTNNARQQAYYTAKSAVDLLAEKIGANNPDLTPTADHPLIEVTELRFDSGMGTCTAQIERLSEDRIRIAANAVYAGEEYLLTLSLTREEGRWVKSRYMYDGESTPTDAGDTTTGTASATTTTTTEPTTATTVKPSGALSGTVGDEINEKRPGNDKKEYRDTRAYNEGDFVYLVGDDGELTWYRAISDIPGGNYWGPTDTGNYLWKRITTAYDPVSVYLPGDIIQTDDGKYYRALVKAFASWPPPTAGVWEEVTYTIDPSGNVIWQRA